MKKPQAIVHLDFKSVQPQTAKTIAIPVQVEKVLKAASSSDAVISGVPDDTAYLGPPPAPKEVGSE